MITWKESKDKIVICKDGAYMSLTDDQVIELSSVLDEIQPEKQVREVLTIDNCIAYLFKNGANIDYSNFIRIKKLYTELSKSGQLQTPEFYNLNP